MMVCPCTISGYNQRHFAVAHWINAFGGEWTGVGEGKGEEKGRGYWRDASIDDNVISERASKLENASAIRNNAFTVIFIVLFLRDIPSISFVNISIYLWSYRIETIQVLMELVDTL